MLNSYNVCCKCWDKLFLHIMHGSYKVLDISLMGAKCNKKISWYSTLLPFNDLVLFPKTVFNVPVITFHLAQRHTKTFTTNFINYNTIYWALKSVKIKSSHIAFNFIKHHRVHSWCHVYVTISKVISFKYDLNPDYMSYFIYSLKLNVTVPPYNQILCQPNWNDVTLYVKFRCNIYPFHCFTTNVTIFIH